MKSIFGGFLDGRDARIDGECSGKNFFSSTSITTSIILKKSLDDVSAGTTNFTYKQ